MTLRDQIVAALKKVYDPEMPVNIYELGLIYDLTVDDAGAAAISMTLTTKTTSARRRIRASGPRATRTGASTSGRPSSH